MNAAAGYAQALWAGKLFHIDLNGQNGPKYDQDLRFGAGNVRGAFWVVDTLLAGGYDGPVHFDYKPARIEDEDGVWVSAAANMRNYLILREKVRAFRADPEVQAALAAARLPELALPTLAEGETWQQLLDWPLPDPEALAAARGRRPSTSTSSRSSTSTASADRLVTRRTDGGGRARRQHRVGATPEHVAGAALAAATADRPRGPSSPHRTGLAKATVGRDRRRTSRRRGRWPRRGARRSRRLARPPGPPGRRCAATASSALGLELNVDYVAAVVLDLAGDGPRPRRPARSSPARIRPRTRWSAWSTATVISPLRADPAAQPGGRDRGGARPGARATTGPSPGRPTCSITGDRVAARVEAALGGACPVRGQQRRRLRGVRRDPPRRGHRQRLRALPDRHGRHRRRHRRRRRTWSGAARASPARSGTCRSATRTAVVRLRPARLLGGLDRAARDAPGGRDARAGHPARHRRGGRRAGRDRRRRPRGAGAARPRRRARALGAGDVLDPAVVVLGGYFVPAGRAGPEPGPAQRSTSGWSRRVQRRPELRLGALGIEAAALGAAERVLRRPRVFCRVSTAGLHGPGAELRTERRSPAGRELSPASRRPADVVDGAAQRGDRVDEERLEGHLGGTEQHRVRARARAATG